MQASLWNRLAASLGLTLSDVEADRELAAGLLASMLAEAPAVRELMACGVERFRSVALLELLLDRSFEPGGGGEDLAHFVAVAMTELAALQLQPQESGCVLDSLRAATAVLGSDPAARWGRMSSRSRAATTTKPGAAKGARHFHGTPSLWRTDDRRFPCR